MFVSIDRYTNNIKTNIASIFANKIIMTSFVFKHALQAVMGGKAEFGLAVNCKGI